jgi:hypothetical protein
MGRASREKVVAEFDERIVIERTMACIENCCPTLEASAYSRSGSSVVCHPWLSKNDHVGVVSRSPDSQGKP